MIFFLHQIQVSGKELIVSHERGETKFSQESKEFLYLGTCCWKTGYCASYTDRKTAIEHEIKPIPIFLGTITQTIFLLLNSFEGRYNLNLL